MGTDLLKKIEIEIILYLSVYICVKRIPGDLNSDFYSPTPIPQELVFVK